MRLAILDFDGTIIRGNSWHEYLRAELMCRPSRIPCLVGALTLRKAGLISGVRLRALVLRGIRGRTRADVDRHGSEICDTRLLGQVRNRAVEEIRRRRAAGYRIAVATGAWDFVVAPCARKIGADVVLSTEVAFSGDRCCGELVPRGELLGAAKADAVLQHFASEEVDWAGSCAFSDSVSDFPLLMLVGEPVFVFSGHRRPRGIPAQIRVECWD